MNYYYYTSKKEKHLYWESETHCIALKRWYRKLIRSNFLRWRITTIIASNPSSSEGGASHTRLFDGELVMYDKYNMCGMENLIYVTNTMYDVYHFYTSIFNAESQLQTKPEPEWCEKYRVCICIVLGSIALWNIDPRYKMSFEMVGGHIWERLVKANILRLILSLRLFQIRQGY